MAMFIFKKLQCYVTVNFSEATVNSQQSLLMEHNLNETQIIHTITFIQIEKDTHRERLNRN